MARKPSLNPPQEFKIYLSQDNAAQLRLMTHDPSSNRAVFGEVSRIANEAFQLYFQRLKEARNGQQ